MFEPRLSDRVKALEDLVIILQARLAVLENQHVFGGQQMNRIEETQVAILTEIKQLKPLQELIDSLTAQLNAAAVKLEGAA